MERPRSDRLCACGCGEYTLVRHKTTKYGRKGEPCEFIRGHYSKFVASQRGAEYRVNEDGCWIWQRSLDKDGYGRCYIGRDRELAKAHRVYYERHVGPIPEGWHVHHKCHVTSCCNPEHLEALPVLVHRRLARDLALDSKKADELRALREAGLTYKALGERFGVSTGTAFHVVKGMTWANA